MIKVCMAAMNCSMTLVNVGWRMAYGVNLSVATAHNVHKGLKYGLVTK